MTASLALPVRTTVSEIYFWDDDPFLFRRLKTWLLLLSLFLLASGNGFVSEQPKYGFTLKAVRAEGEPRDKLVYFTIAMLLIGVGIMARWIRPTIRQMLRQKHVLAFALLAIISTVWSQVPDQTIRKAILLLFSMVFAWFFSTYYSPADQIRILIALGAGVVVSSIAWVILLPQYGMSYSGDWKGIFGQKNLLGSSIVFLFSGAIFFRAPSRLDLLKWVVPSMFPLGLLIMSQSRTSWVLAILLVGFRILGPIIVRIRREAIPFMLFSAVFGVIIALVGLSAVLSLVGRDLSFTGRTHEWKVIFPFALTHFWFGYGYQGFWTGTQGDSGRVDAILGAVTTVADNGYLDIMLQFGVLGIVMLVVMLAISIRDFLRSLRRSSVPLVAFWYTGIIFIVFVGSYTEGMFWMPVRIIPFMLTLACAGLRNLGDDRDFSHFSLRQRSS
jgi:exopolysaccharide production protein ExoQ